jgi:hypothetical protein
MASANPEQSSAAPEAAEEMVRYGITQVPVDYFHCGEFRYTNLMDAAAQAERAKQRTNALSSAVRLEATDEMVRYGITRVPVDYFHCGEFRYTNLKDAVAQAKRQQPSN